MASMSNTKKMSVLVKKKRAWHLLLQGEIKLNIYIVQCVYQCKNLELCLFNRPGLAGAVLQTPLLLIQ